MQSEVSYVCAADRWPRFGDQPALHVSFIWFPPHHITEWPAGHCNGLIYVFGPSEAGSHRLYAQRQSPSYGPLLRPLCTKFMQPWASPPCSWRPESSSCCTLEHPPSTLTLRMAPFHPMHPPCRRPRAAPAPVSSRGGSRGAPPSHRGATPAAAAAVSSPRAHQRHQELHHAVLGPHPRRAGAAQQRM